MLERTPFGDAMRTGRGFCLKAGWGVVCGFKANADVVDALNVLRKGRTGPSAHNKKHIAHVVSVGEQGFQPEDSMPSMGAVLKPRDRVAQGIPALLDGEEVKKALGKDSHCCSIRLVVLQN